MKNNKLILLLFLAFLGNQCSTTQKLPKKQTSLDKMRLANAYFMQKWPDAGKPIWAADKTRPSNIWTRAVYYEGLMALYNIDTNTDTQKSYLQYATEWGEKHKWNLRNGTTTRNGDDQACGQTYIDLYLMDKNPERITAIKTTLDNMVKTDKKDDWSWVDAIQMAMPVFTQLGVVYNDKRYFDKMYDLYHFTKTQHSGKGLYNPEEHLWWRDKDFIPPYKEPNGKNCYWSRGNGWVFAALVRVLDILPNDEPHRAEYLQDFKEMAEALIPIQRPDGYWNVSLHDPTNYGGKELSGTAFFTYGMAWGINKGILDGKKYKPVVVKAWQGLQEAVHPNGFLGYVQGTGKEPKDGQPVTFDKIPNFEDFGLGSFLLAGSEVYKMK
jgi:unsaturated rhamnogalacturonyl hydrolase